MRDLARACLIALTIPLLVMPRAFGGSASAYLACTGAFLLVNLALVATWDWFDEPARHRTIRTSAVTMVVAAAAGLLLFYACRSWLDQILTYPNDAQRADMLIVVQQGIRRMLQGRNPYTLYHVPWEVTLPYGPLLWGPYIVPYVLHADVRFVSILGELFVPAACALTASGLAWSGRYLAAAAALLMLTALALTPDLRNFSAVAHTPSYWPLLAAFAWLVTRERWRAVALLAGLLVVARTTMIAIAPIVLMTVWHRDRQRIVSATALLALAAIVPFLPFAIWDLAALKYALYGSYESLMKGFVWTSTPWARETVGVTGLLLRAGWPSLVQPAQMAALLVVYAFAWRALRAGDRPLPWMALALLVFCMTSLWPVHYIYLDVILLWVCGALAETSWFEARRLAPVWGATFALSALLLAAMAWATIPADPEIDVGAPADRARLYAGFADDERGDRSFTWVDGKDAKILVPRRTRREAVIEIVCQPNLPARGATQEMSVVLNGVVLGTVPLREGWQSVSLTAPSRAWTLGLNEVALSFANAISPLEAGVGADARKLSVAFDRLTVRSR